VNMADLINGLFEFCGSLFIFLSVKKLHQDKHVAGVSWLHAGFFLAWGWWNLAYYPHLGQWISLAGGLAIVVMNSIWFGQLIYYSSQPQPSGQYVMHEIVTPPGCEEQEWAEKQSRVRVAPTSI